MTRAEATGGTASVAGRRQRTGDLLATTRPGQWPKNLIVFGALIFSAGSAWSWREPAEWLPLLGAATLAFVLFTAASAGAYCVNDALDAERDRLHPRKQLRPVAAARLSRGLAGALGGGLLVAGVLVAAALSWQLGAVALGYAALTTAYSAALKRVVVLDVIVIAIGFVLRAIGGAVAIGVPASPWLLLITLLGALALAVNKRRQELALFGDAAAAHREALDAYSVPLLDHMSSVAMSATIVSYALYAISADNVPADHSMLLTLPWVLYGLFRFSLLAERSPDRGVDELLFRDRGMALSILGFTVTALGVLIAHG